MSVSDDSIISALRVSFVPLTAAPVRYRLDIVKFGKWPILFYDKSFVDSNENRTAEHIVYLCVFVYPFKLLNSFRIPALYNVCFVFVLLCVLKFCCDVSFIGCSFFRMEK